MQRPLVLGQDEGPEDSFSTLDVAHFSLLYLMLGITQPPVAAMSVRFLYEHAEDPLLAMSKAGLLFPKVSFARMMGDQSLEWGQGMVVSDGRNVLLTFRIVKFFDLDLVQSQ
jgi:hypothetical protein